MSELDIALGIVPEEDAPDIPEENDAEESAPASSEIPPAKDAAGTQDDPSAETAATDSTEEPAADEDGTDATPAPGREAQTSEPFVWAGQEYRSKEDAEQDSRTWRGRLQAEQSRGAERDKQINEYWEYAQAISKENDELRARFESPDTNKKTATEADATSTVEGVDWDRLARVRANAEKLGLDPVATVIRAYDQDVSKLMEKKLSTLLDERLRGIEEPVRSMEEAKTVNSANREMFLWAQSQKNGQAAAYPELQKDTLDEGFTSTMFQVWDRLGKEYGPKYAYSAAGIDYAYRLTRDAIGKPAGSPAPSSAPRDANGRFTAANADGQASSEMAGTNVNPTKTVKKSWAKEALEELGAHRPLKNGETELGFYE